MDWHSSVCTDHKILDNEVHDEDESFLGFREVSMGVMNVPRQNFHMKTKSYVTVINFAFFF